MSAPELIDSVLRHHGRYTLIAATYSNGLTWYKITRGEGMFLAEPVALSFFIQLNGRMVASWDDKRTANRLMGHAHRQDSQVKFL